MPAFPHAADSALPSTGFPAAENASSNSSRIALLFASLPFFTALKLALFFVLKRLLNPECSVNYSQTGEDAVVRALLNEYRPGFYIDVGCNDPIASSNTLSLYLHGWRGIVIDANARAIERFRKIRRRDIALCAAVSDEEKEMVFHEFDFDLVSTLSEEVLDEYRGKWSECGQRQVRTRTLNSLLQEHLPAQADIGLLSIDVEGHDLQVLRSIDLNRYRPTLILVEILHFDMRAAAGEPVVCHLAGFDYQLVAYDSLNAYFIDRRSPRAGLLPR